MPKNQAFLLFFMSGLSALHAAESNDLAHLRESLMDIRHTLEGIHDAGTYLPTPPALSDRNKQQRTLERLKIIRAAIEERYKEQAIVGLFTDAPIRAPQMRCLRTKPHELTCIVPDFVTYAQEQGRQRSARKEHNALHTAAVFSALCAQQNNEQTAELAHKLTKTEKTLSTVQEMLVTMHQLAERQQAELARARQTALATQQTTHHHVALLEHTVQDLQEKIERQKRKQRAEKLLATRPLIIPVFHNAPTTTPNRLIRYTASPEPIINELVTHARHTWNTRYRETAHLLQRFAQEVQQREKLLLSTIQELSGRLKMHEEPIIAHQPAAWLSDGPWRTVCPTVTASIRPLQKNHPKPKHVLTERFVASELAPTELTPQCLLGNRYRIQPHESSALAITGLADLYTYSMYGHGLELLRCDAYDSYAFTEQIMDAGVHTITPIAHKPTHHLECASVVRAHGIFGRRPVIHEPIKIGMGHTENSYPFFSHNYHLIMRELWLAYHAHSCNDVSIRIGLFPYSIGNGLVLGNAHVVNHHAPGFYCERFVDQWRPGVLLEGAFCDKRMTYQAYYGVLHTSHYDFCENARFIRAHEARNRLHPGRGDDASGFIAATRFAYHTDCQRLNCTGSVAPYLVATHDNEQTVEFLGDAVSTLVTPGAEIHVQTDSFAFNCEFARNFGGQRVKAIDRNEFMAIGPNVMQTHLFERNCTDTAWIAATNQTEPEDLGFTKNNCAEFTDQQIVADDGTTVIKPARRFKNSCSRFRKEYCNTYRGMMFTADASYFSCNTPTAKNRWSCAFGIASGDESPNDTPEKILAHRFDSTFSDRTSDHCKPYKGFVGTQSMYTGTVVPAFFLLEARRLNTPLNKVHDWLTEPEFTNIAYLGFGTAIERACDYWHCAWSANFLAYFQTHATRRGYSMTLDQFFQMQGCPEMAQEEFLPCITCLADQCTDNTVALELNAMLRWTIGNNLRIHAIAALFKPQDYYDNRKGTYIPLKDQFKLARADNSGFENIHDKYAITLQDNTSYFFDCGFEYAFDIPLKRTL